MIHIIARSSGEDELCIGVERKTVYVCPVSIHLVDGVGSGVASVPDEELLVISDRPKEGVMVPVPSDVLHHFSVAGEDGARLQVVSLLCS